MKQILQRMDVPSQFRNAHKKSRFLVADHVFETIRDAALLGLYFLEGFERMSKCRLGRSYLRVGHGKGTQRAIDDQTIEGQPARANRFDEMLKLGKSLGSGPRNHNET